MLGPNRKKHHISNVNIKLYGSLSIRDAHLKGKDTSEHTAHGGEVLVVKNRHNTACGSINAP